MTAHEEARSGRKAPESSPYRHPAAGWGAAKSVAQFLVREPGPVSGTRAIQRMNHENGGFDCPGIASITAVNRVQSLVLPTVTVKAICPLRAGGGEEGAYGDR